MSRHAFKITMGLTLGLMFATTIFSQEDTLGPEKGIFDQLALVADEDTASDTTGAQPQSKGLVHEAFATPTVFTATPGAVVAKQPPSLEELPPEQKPDGDNVQWINGYAAWDDDRADFYWVSGIWRNIPPNMEWVPGTWNEVQGGWQYFAGFWKQTSAGELQVVPPPPTAPEVIDPPAPDNESVYIPGSWVYRENQYVWRTAQWVPFRAGWVWVPARYLLTRVGWVFLEGYWDYTLGERGLLFCPVQLDASCYQPGFVHRPTHVVHDQCLLSCLFVHAQSGCYHFGNYYDNKYVQSGYTPWTSYRVSKQCEPLFNQYRCLNKHDNNWERNLGKLQQDRFKGDAPKPAENLLRQRTLVKGNNAHVSNLALVASLNKVNSKAIQIKKLDTTQFQQHVQIAKQQKEASILRAQNENRMTTLGNIRIGDKAKTLNLGLPKSAVTFQQPSRVFSNNNSGSNNNQPRNTGISIGNLGNSGNNGGVFKKDTGIKLNPLGSSNGSNNNQPRILTNPNGSNNNQPRIGSGTGIQIKPNGGGFQFPNGSNNNQPRILSNPNSGLPRIGSGSTGGNFQPRNFTPSNQPRIGNFGGNGGGSGPRIRR